MKREPEERQLDRCLRSIGIACLLALFAAATTRGAAADPHNLKGRVQRSLVRVSRPLTQEPLHAIATPLNLLALKTGDWLVKQPQLPPVQGPAASESRLGKDGEIGWCGRATSDLLPGTASLLFAVPQFAQVGLNPDYATIEHGYVLCGTPDMVPGGAGQLQTRNCYCNTSIPSSSCMAERTSSIYAASYAASYAAQTGWLNSRPSSPSGGASGRSSGHRR